MTFEEWFKQNEQKLPSWYSNPYDEDALRIAFEAGYRQGHKEGYIYRETVYTTQEGGI